MCPFLHLKVLSEGKLDVLHICWDSCMSQIQAMQVLTWVSVFTGWFGPLVPFWQIKATGINLSDAFHVSGILRICNLCKCVLSRFGTSQPCFEESYALETRKTSLLSVTMGAGYRQGENEGFDLLYRYCFSIVYLHLWASPGLLHHLQGNDETCHWIPLDFILFCSFLNGRVLASVRNRVRLDWLLVWSDLTHYGASLLLKECC